MKLRNNKGYVGADIAVSILIMTILIPTLGAMIYNVNKAGRKLERKSFAINLATNVIETAKQVENIENLYSNIDVDDTKTATNDDFISRINNSSVITNIEGKAEIKDTQGNQAIIFNVTDNDKNIYQVTTKVIDYADELKDNNETLTKNLVKTVNVIVEYSIGRGTEKIEISNVITKK